MPLTAGTPLDVLTNRLQKAGWGDLGTPTLRGLARVLDALAGTLNPRTGAGKTTAPQLAEKTCYTERWVRRCLTLLEELELIEWHRGGIHQGKPTPSWIRVSKAALVDLVHLARVKQGERTRDAARARRVRMAGLRTTSTTHRRTAVPRDRKAPRRDEREVHAELGSALLSVPEEVSGGGGGSASGGKPQAKNDAAGASQSSAQSALAAIRADLAARRQRQEGKGAATTRAG